MSQEKMPHKFDRFIDVRINVVAYSDPSKLPAWEFINAVSREIRSSGDTSGESAHGYKYTWHLEDKTSST